MKRKRGALEKVEADLPNLQHKIRSDPASYRDEFINQYGQYRSLLELFLQTPTSTSTAEDNNSNSNNGVVKLRDLIDFVSHVAHLYPDVTRDFASDLIGLLERRHHHSSPSGGLEGEIRDKVVGSLVLLRRKEVIGSAALVNVLWPTLVATPSKSLRALLFRKILADVRAANAKTTNHGLNRMVQTLCLNLVAADPTSQKGLWAVKLTRELWRRQVWSDAKAVGIMEMAALSGQAKVVASGVRFFLGGDKEREEAAEDQSDDEDEPVDMGKLRHQAGVNKRSGKRSKELKAAAARVKRREKKKRAPHALNFSALHLLNDPQGFTEKLFQQHLQPVQPRVRLNLEQKVVVLQLVSRLVGLHKLTLIQLYSYFIKYLTPRQPSVTSFLACLAQATHDLVPPDVLEPLVQKIANEFVSEAAAAEVASAGLNGIREVCVRQPLAMSETLLQDLVQYRKSKDKGMQMAARGLLGLYREVGADLLRKKDRGRDAALRLRAGGQNGARFGQVEGGGIEGLDLLEKWKEEQGLEEEDEEDEAKGWENWDAESDTSESSGGWINVESEGEDIDVSDSEEDKDGKAKGSGKAEAEAKATNDRGVVGEDGATRPDEIKAAVEREESRTSKLAITRILTPADLAKLHELRTSAAITSAMPSAKRRKMQQQSGRHSDDALTAADIEGLAALSRKMSKAEKVAMAKGQRPEGGEEAETNDHRSTTARRKEKKAAEGKSTTNKEKARKKNFMMTLGKAKRKGKRSLVEHRKILKAHVDRGKRGGKRGNR